LPTSLYVAWQNQATRAWHTVARLRRLHPGYEFVFTQGVSNLLTIPSELFQMDVKRRYSSDELLPLFKNRLPSRNRTDFSKMVEWLNLSGDEDEYDLLTKFGLIPGTDSLLVYPEPEVTLERYQLEFFVHGIRHMRPDAIELCNKLTTGERLLPLLDVQNPFDQNAVAIRGVEGGVLVGYVPSFYAADFRQLLSEPEIAAKARLTVVRSNKDAPSQLKLLCRFECSIWQGFQALSTDNHQPIIDGAAAHDTVNGPSIVHSPMCLIWSPAHSVAT
jgi:hypothetical protein